MDRTASYSFFLDKVDVNKEYEVIKTVPSKKALKILAPKKFAIAGDECLMNSYIQGIEKTMKIAKEKYDCFAQKINVGLWSGLETPRVHVHEKGKIDLKDLILNSHKNQAFENGDFKEYVDTYLPPAEFLRKKDVSMLEITDEWNTPGSQLRRFNDFFRQQIEEGSCGCCSED